MRCQCIVQILFHPSPVRLSLLKSVDPKTGNLGRQHSATEKPLHFTNHFVILEVLLCTPCWCYIVSSIHSFAISHSQLNGINVHRYKISVDNVGFCSEARTHTLEADLIFISYSSPTSFSTLSEILHVSIHTRDSFFACAALLILPLNTISPIGSHLKMGVECALGKGRSRRAGKNKDTSWERSEMKENRSQ